MATYTVIRSREMAGTRWHGFMGPWAPRMVLFISRWSILHHSQATERMS